VRCTVLNNKYILSLERLEDLQETVKNNFCKGHTEQNNRKRKATKMDSNIQHPVVIIIKNNNCVAFFFTKIIVRDKPCLLRWAYLW